jgi:hypothetical protein
VHVVIFTVELAQLGAEVAADLPHGVLAAGEHVRVEHATPVLGHEDQMNVGRGNHVSATALRRHGGVCDTFVGVPHLGWL